MVNDLFSFSLVDHTLRFLIGIVLVCVLIVVSAIIIELDKTQDDSW